MKKFMVLGAVAVFVATVGTSKAIAGSKTYRGKWNGKFSTSFTITDGKRKHLRYCFQGSCSHHGFSGSLDKIRFSDRNGTWVFTKRGKGYKGWYKYRLNGSVSTAVFR